VNQGAGAGNYTQSSAIAPAQPSSTPPAEQSVRTAPVAYSSRDTLNAVITATLGAVAVALAALLIVGWLMRRRRPAAVATPGQNPLPPSAASGPDEPQVQH
jgi:hypothetical protein